MNYLGNWTSFSIPFIAERKIYNMTIIGPAKLRIYWLSKKMVSFPDEIIDYVFGKQSLLGKDTITAKVTDMSDFFL